MVLDSQVIEKALKKGALMGVRQFSGISFHVGARAARGLRGVALTQSAARSPIFSFAPRRRPR